MGEPVWSGGRAYIFRLNVHSLFGFALSTFTLVDNILADGHLLKKIEDFGEPLDFLFKLTGGSFNRN
jgi:hypothetical protein